MKRHFTIACLHLLATGLSISQPLAEQWPGFRGYGNSQSSVLNLPIDCGDQAITWKAVLPGVGQSSPIRWGQRLFCTSVEGKKKQTLWVLCHDLATGETLWKHSRDNSTSEEVTDYNSWAAPTPVADETRLYVLFETGDLVVFDHAGKLLWQSNLASHFGPFEGNHGQGASPILTRQGLVVLLDQGGDSFLVSIDKASGNLLWKTPRDTGSSWSSPVLHQNDEGQESIICSAGGSVSCYDATDGHLKWTFDSITSNNVPSATIIGNQLLAGSSRKNNTQLLRFSETEVKRVWRAKEATSSFGSPLVHRGRVYIVNKVGILFCYRLDSGKLLFEHRLATSTWASPLGCGERIYFFSTDGSTAIFKSSDQVEMVAESKLELAERDRVYGYAIGPGKVILRTRSELICLGN